MRDSCRTLNFLWDYMGIDVSYRFVIKNSYLLIQMVLQPVTGKNKIITVTGCIFV